MKETEFIRQNKEKWSLFDKGYREGNNLEPEQLTQLYIQITDDLSYAQTHYPNRSVRIFLNRLAQNVYFSIYRNRVHRWRKFSLFWKEELPSVFYHGRKEALFSTVLFLISFSIGMLSSAQDPQFARFILGDSYVEMTEENISSGDPMKVYKERGQGDMFMGITLNNLKVAFYTFLFGITLGFGTAVFILYNGVMIGTFQYFFIERGLFAESFLTIWVHGAMEVSAIIIAGAAGFALGRSILFPGTYSRSASLRIGAVKAFKMFMGIVPIIIIAGFLEAFFTRYTEVPQWIRAIIIGAEFAFMIFYYVVYPLRKGRTGYLWKERPDELFVSAPQKVVFSEVKKESQVFAEAFTLYRLHSRSLIRWVSILAGITTLALVVGQGWDSLNTAAFVLRDLDKAFSFTRYPLVFPVMAVCLGLLFYISAGRIVSMATDTPFNFSLYKVFIPIGLTSVWLLPFLIDGVAGDLLPILFFPVLLYLITWMADLRQSGVIPPSYFRLLGSQFSGLLFALASILLLSFILLTVTDGGLTYFHLELLKWNIPFDELLLSRLTDVLITYTMCWIFLAIMPLAGFCFALFYFSSKETETAVNLKERIKNGIHA